MFFPGQTVEFYMTADEALNGRDCFSGQEGTEDGADPDAIKAMQDRKRQEDGRGQTAEIKTGFYYFVFFCQDLRKITWKNICRNDRKHAVVCKADADTHNNKSC